LAGWALVFSVFPLAAADSSVLLDAMTQELQRNFSVLQKKADPAPYYLSYEVTDQETFSVTTALGALAGTGHSHNRYLDVSVRVGSPKLDNYHRVRGQRGRFTSGALVSLDDNADAIKRRLWLDTDRAYRAAAERLIQIRTNSQVNVAEEDSSDDFSKEEPAVHEEAPRKVTFSNAEWTERARKWSSRFRNYAEVLTAGVSVMAQTDTRYFVNTEGSRLRHGRGFARIVISAEGKAEDGMDLATFESFEATDPGGLPDDKAVQAAVDRVARDLTGLLHAQVAEPFVGPAIFSGRAAGVFFHEIFGHRVEGHRQKDVNEGQTFTRSVGTKVLPEFLSVVFDPTRRKSADVDLNGWYSYDDEGVAARPVTVVESGTLKTFLLSRSPVQGFAHSNGHGRRQPGAEVVARQSNLLVESSRMVPEKRLRQMLVEEIKRQGKPYGLYFQEVTGGFTNTARGGVQAFKVIPLVVYRVYADGRKDELVRGVDIVGTPLASFAKILATSDRAEVFNGYCGAESGSVPVAAVSPALLVSEIEVEKKTKSQDRPPLLPAPGETGAGN
jgi:predicted Zn-dependent protease